MFKVHLCPSPLDVQSALRVKVKGNARLGTTLSESQVPVALQGDSFEARNVETRMPISPGDTGVSLATRATTSLTD